MTVRRAVAAVALAVLLVAGARRLGPMPPLGPLLDPANGVWAIATTANLPTKAQAVVPGLDSAVRVEYDDRGVPHIFAKSELDAYHALGYVVARDRLFQLELQARAGAGTLTELFGPAALGADREVRGLGFSRAAERILASLAPGSEARHVLDAYSDGVNGYIGAMSPRDLPLEYRLLDRRPARWRPIDVVHVFLRMGYLLARSRRELDHAATAAVVGDAAADALFPVNAPVQVPIQPSPYGPRTLPVTLPPPGAPDTAARRALEVARVFDHRPPAGDGAQVGSNNWAVAPARTRNGFALLAGDPHLDLTLPSIWYEAHLVAPPALDVYGVTVPGMPMIALGFNRDVAWTFTNAESDVLDYWTETVDDPRRPTRYRLDGDWRPLERREERYRDAQGRTIAVDTLRFTHRGPLRQAGGRWVSMRWTVLEAGQEIRGFLGAAHARTAAEWLAAMEPFAAPAQNMLVADRGGHIAIRSTGRFPIRPGDGRGDRPRDGGTSRNDWTGDWPIADYPQAIDPAQGFLESANQQPIDPAVQPRYLGVNWPSPWRAWHLDRLLRGDSAVTPETMQRWQTDPGTPRADRFAPYFVAAAAHHPDDTVLAHAGRLLGAWDRRYTRENERAILFETAMSELARRTWDELGPMSHATPLPSGMILAALLDDSASVWWDDRATTHIVERRDDVLAASLRAGYLATVAAHGPPERGGWRWSAVHRIDVSHLLRLPSLSATGLSVPGGTGTLNPSAGGGEGPSWRMVVELGPEIRAWGTYPGGQSGNPASRRYTDRLPLWLDGRLDSLHMPRRAGEIHVSATLLLSGHPERSEGAEASLRLPRFARDDKVGRP